MSALSNGSTAESVNDHSMFRQAPLTDSSNQIRLLRIERGEWNDPLRCTIGTYDLGSCPKFRAISYARGSRHSQEYIRINDHDSFKIRPNCAYALRQYRALSHDVPVWIDSICIDQDDNFEKGKQVQIMGTIFSRAELVAACVGPHEDESSMVIEAINGRTYHADDLEKMKRLGKALRHFGSRPYWSRLWIVQELLTGAHVSVLCGESTIRKLEELRLWILRCPVAFQPWGEGTAVRRLLDRHFPYALHLYDVIHEFRSLHCAQMRDHVFGLLAASCQYGQLDSPMTSVEAHEIRLGPLRIFERLVRNLQIKDHDLAFPLEFANEPSSMDLVKRLEGGNRLRPFDPDVERDFLRPSRPRSWIAIMLERLAVDFTNWSLEIFKGEWNVLHLSNDGELICSDNPSDRTGCTPRKSSLEGHSMAYCEANFRKVFHKGIAVALVSGEARPGDIILNGGDYLEPLRWDKLCGRWRYAPVIRHYRGHVYQIVAISVYDYLPLHGTTRRPAIFALRKAEASWLFARGMVREQQAADREQHSTHTSGSHNMYVSGGYCYSRIGRPDWSSMAPRTRLRTRASFPTLLPSHDEFCLDFLAAAAKCSPVSSFVYVFDPIVQKEPLETYAPEDVSLQDEEAIWSSLSTA